MTLAALTAPATAAEPIDRIAIETAWTSEVRLLLARFCHECHAADLVEADIDLGSFTSIADVRSQPKVWQKVREMLETGQMPPVDAEQPSDAERAVLQQWVRQHLTSEAIAHAGDPGPVVVRRLSNAEYTYTIRDLTGIATLDPAREFPVDGAAGEGFTNTGSALVMSSSLVVKYLDAAKEIASHAVLLPEGIRFSPHSTHRDRTDDLLAGIQALYRRFTDDEGGFAFDLQGVKFRSNQGGQLPVQRYLEATLVEREAITTGAKTTQQVARERGLSGKYLAKLWEVLADDESSSDSLLLDAFQRHWRTAGVEDAATLAAEVIAWQQALWKFNSVGQIGREGGPQKWMEPVTPLISRQEFRVPLPEAAPGDSVVLYLSAGNPGDGNEQVVAVCERPRIEFKEDEPGSARDPILLRDVRQLTRNVRATLASELPRTDRYLAAMAELRTGSKSLEQVAAEHAIMPILLERWIEYLDLGHSPIPRITGQFTNKLTRVQGYEAINGWGSTATPSMLTNGSDEPLAVATAMVPARSVAVHPSPTQDSVIAWRSPLEGRVRIRGRVADADRSCGNGTAWHVELLSSSGSLPVAKGTVARAGEGRFEPGDAFAVHLGDVVKLVVNARDGNYNCDTTQIDLTLTEVDGDRRIWDLASDVVDQISQSNPVADAYGHAGIWHFGAHNNKPTSKVAVPPGSVLANWREAVVDVMTHEALEQRALSVQAVLNTGDEEALSEPDRAFVHQVTEWFGPLDWISVGHSGSNAPDVELEAPQAFGLESSLFGGIPGDNSVDPASLCVTAPSVIEIRLPADLLEPGAEFVTAGTLHAASGRGATAQLQVLTTTPRKSAIAPGVPILVDPQSPLRPGLDSSLADFRELFPPALCYAQIVPVDEVVTLLLFYREDEPLQRLMLDDSQVAELDQLWDELLWVSQEPLALVVALEQLEQFATQDRPDLVTAFSPMREPINARAEAFRRRLVESEPSHVEAVLDFADRAWRRPLTKAEKQDLRDLYHELRRSEIGHDDAIRLTIARVLTSPVFLYRREQPGPGDKATPVSNDELASRLSYFLWSSLPDDELRSMARGGRLTDETELVSQARRMLSDARTRRLAIQFACQWLDVRDFDQNDDKNEALYPEFATLRGAMYEETVLFFEEMFRNDGSVLGLLNADHTFLNEALAKHYGIDGIEGPEWRRVDSMLSRGRGGILGMATVLASQSGASRTSAILRGNWVSETLLGERLPRPPANVPQLPEAVPTGLTARQLIEQHSSVPECAKCHAKIDPYGFALEQFDAIGRTRSETVDTRTTLVDGKSIKGLEGLRDYLAGDRRDDVVQQFCRKLLGYALGREVQLSDEVLLSEMKRRLATHDYRFSEAVMAIVTSRQFREIRGRRMTDG